MNIIISLIIGGIAGWLAGLVRNGHGFGIFGNIIIGLIGGIIGGFVFGILGIQDTNFLGTIIVSTLGAVLILGVFNIFNGSK